MPDTEKFSLRSYFWVLTRLLREPGKFFAELPQEIGLKHSISFLFVSSLFFTAAGLLSNTYSSPVSTGIIFFVNAMGMVFIAAGFGYIVMTMTIKRSVTFARFFSVYAFSSSITLLVSWVPFFIWLTEPWKWWLIGTGMMKCCGFRLRQAALVIGVSICLMFLLFLSLLPIL